MEKGNLPLSILAATASKIEDDDNADLAKAYAAAVITRLVKSKGADWVKEMWRKNSLTWTQFMPAGQVEAFVKAKVT